MAKEPRIIRYYRGNQIEANNLFLEDSKLKAADGYFPTSQQWAPGAYGCAFFLVALVLSFVLIGILMFVYMVIVKPKGLLTVTYEYREGKTLTLDDSKTCPQCAETVKSAAVVCRYCTYNFEKTKMTS